MAKCRKHFWNFAFRPLNPDSVIVIVNRKLKGWFKAVSRFSLRFIWLMIFSIHANTKQTFKNQFHLKFFFTKIYLRILWEMNWQFSPVNYLNFERTNKPVLDQKKFFNHFETKFLTSLIWTHFSRSTKRLSRNRFEGNVDHSNSQVRW